jgi:hypothetical protein
MSDICRTFVLVVFAMLNRIVPSASHLVIPYRLRVLPTERLELGHSLSALDVYTLAMQVLSLQMQRDC